MYYNPIHKYETTLLWCSDGWVYDPIAKTRRQFLTDGTDIFMHEEPSVQTVFSDIQNAEVVTVSVLSLSPRVWVEQSSCFIECYA